MWSSQVFPFLLTALFAAPPLIAACGEPNPCTDPTSQAREPEEVTMSGIFARKPVSLAANGIVVGEPKVFDNRDLEIILDDLASQVRGLRSVDQAKILAALENLQGSQARSLSTKVEAKPLALPGVERSEEVGAAGTLAPKSLKTTSSEQTPTPPDLGAAPSLSLPVSNFGFSDQDLLTRQIDLQYQITNVRMLLQRSVSDRFYDGGTKGAGKIEPGARLMVVVGFQISLAPSVDHRGMAAQVEIQIEPCEDSRRRPSLVALMPQQKTYNAASLSKKSNAFGAVAPVSVFTLGASVSSNSETFYLYQDADTYAFELPSGGADSKTLRFGWQFRPVLGKLAVEPGLRQLFAVIALDEVDSARTRTRCQTNNNDPTGVPLNVTARTHWLKYNSKKRLPKGEPQMARDEYETKPFLVPITEHLQSSLTPKITAVGLESIGAGKALVKISGENFSRDTSVTIGDEAIEPNSPAFVIRSNNQLQFVASISDLLNGETVLTGGRYGFSTPVRDPRVTQRKTCPAEQPTVATPKPGGFFVRYGTCGTRKGDFVEFYVALTPRGYASKVDLLGQTVFLDFGGEIHELPPERWKPTAPCGEPLPSGVTPEEGLIWQSIDVSFRLLESDRKVFATIPFLGEEYQSSAWFHPPVGITKIVELEKGDAKGKKTIWGLVGYGLQMIEPSLKVYAGREYTGDKDISSENSQLLKLTGSFEELSQVKEVVILAPGFFEPKTLKAPNQPAPKGKPVITQTPTVPKASSGSAVFKGENLKTIQKVEFEGAALKHMTQSDTELTVFLTRAVTKEAGPVTLLGYFDDTTFITLNLTIQ